SVASSPPEGPASVTRGGGEVDASPCAPVPGLAPASTPAAPPAGRDAGASGEPLHAAHVIAKPKPKPRPRSERRPMCARIATAVPARRRREKAREIGRRTREDAPFPRPL